jgi:hypothetical protein
MAGTNVVNNNTRTDLERILNALDTRNLLLGTATSSLDNRTEAGDADSFRLNQARYIPPLWTGKGIAEPGCDYATESGKGQWFRP